MLAAARNPDQLADLRSRYGDKIHTASLDVTSEAQAKDAVEAAVAKFGGLDVLVNNAGYGNVCPVENTPLDDFRAQIKTNLFGVISETEKASYFAAGNSVFGLGLIGLHKGG